MRNGTDYSIFISVAHFFFFKISEFPAMFSLYVEQYNTMPFNYTRSETISSVLWGRLKNAKIRSREYKFYWKRKNK